MKFKVPKIETSASDDCLYLFLIQLLDQIKIVQGGTNLAYTLRNHPHIRDYLISKQIAKINSFDSVYFHPDGTLDSEAVSALNKNTDLFNILQTS